MSYDIHRKCSKCGATPYQDKTVILHRFPKLGKTNALKLKAWAMYCWPEKDWTAMETESLEDLFKQHKMLCGKHFEDDCFTDSSKKRLFPNSVPGTREYVIEILKFLQENSGYASNFQVTAATRPETIAKLGPSAEPGSSVVPGLSAEPGPSVVPGPSAERSQEPGPSGTTEYVEFIEEVLVKKKDKKSNLRKKKGILRPIDVDKLEELSTREKKIYLSARRSIQEISRLRKRLKGRPKSHKIEKLRDDDDVNKLLNLNLSSTFALLLQSEMRNGPKKPHGRRYNLEQKIMALTMFKKSPACYRLLRRMFALPSQSTLNKLLNKVPLQTGINKQIFVALKTMAQTQSPEENMCSLLFDEMSIRKHLAYNHKLDYIEGYQDHGDQGRTDQIASNVLVFMLTGVRKRWKQPVAFYFSAKSLTSDRLAVLIKQVLDECSSVGLNVVATICDLSGVNIKALEILGAKSEMPYFNHKDKEIVSILDPPHLLKCLRNLFLKYNIECPTDMQIDGKTIIGTAKWSHIRDFYVKDKNNPIFEFAPALTEAHINPNMQQKMRVKLAAQIFSHTVAAGILSRIAMNELSPEAIATVALLSKFDTLFDGLNADTPDLRRGKKYATNFTHRSKHIFLLNEMIEFINNMKYINCKSLPPSHTGWIRTINAVKRLWENLNKVGIHSLSTRRLNQDPLENLFGCIRYNCGSNVNPTVGQFIAGIKTAIISNLRNNSRRKNCEDDSGILSCNLKTFLRSESKLLESEDKIIDKNETQESGVNIDIECLLADAIEAVEQASSEAQACAYVCGFMIKKITERCINCKNNFISNELEPIHIFTSFKEFNTMQNSLKYVNKNFVHCVELCSNIMQNFFKTEGHKKNIRHGAISALQAVDFDFINCPTHGETNNFFVKKSIFHICVKRFTLLENRKYIEEEKRKSLKRKINTLLNQ